MHSVGNLVFYEELSGFVDELSEESLMNFLRIAVWLGALVIVWSAGQDVHAQRLSSFDFLRIESSAKAAAFGGTILSASSAPSHAMFYNPALPGSSTDRHLSISWLNHLSNLQAGTVTYGQNLETLGLLSSGVRFFSWGQIDRADEFGETSGTFSSSSFALSSGLSRTWNQRIRYGANVHLIYTSIAEYNAFAVALDVGGVYHVEDQGLTLALGATNMGLAFSSLGQTTDRVPFDVRFTASKRLRYIPFLIGVTLHDLGHVHDVTSVEEGFGHTIVSLEFQAIPVFHVRMGYSHRKRGLKSDRRLDFAGTSMGFGLRLRRFHFDYSFSSWSFAGLHQFTISTQFRKRDQ